MPTTNAPRAAGSFGEFIGTVRAEWITPDRDMRLLAPFAYLDAERVRWEAPTGTRIDGASIPRVLWTLVGSPFTGRYRRASVLHDVACVERSRPWRAVHRMFYFACRCGGMGELKAKLMFAAVYHFGPRWGPGAVAVPASLTALAELRALVARNPSLEDIEHHAPATSLVAEARGPGGRSAREPRDLLAALRLGLPQSAALLDPETHNRILERLERRFSQADRAAGPPDADTGSLRQQVRSHLPPALTALGIDGRGASLAPEARLALEAVIEMTDRPSIVIKGGDLQIDLTDPDLNEWKAAIEMNRQPIRNTIASVGRIDLDGQQVGTGFVVAPGIVMTSRNVLEVLADEISPGGLTRWTFDGSPTINFLAEAGSSAELRFPLTEVLFAGPTPTNGQVDPLKLDMALLRIDPAGVGQAVPPPPLCLASSQAASALRTMVYTVGYSAEPAVLPRDGTDQDRDLVDALRRIFRVQFGVKRLSPGLVSRGVGAVTGDTHRWLLGHDASTLGGSSGSCVVGLDGNSNPVLGLHLAGTYLDVSLAHVLANVRKAWGGNPPAQLNWI